MTRLSIRRQLRPLVRQISRRSWRCGFGSFVLLLFGCGKVGDPQPPFVRIPEAVQDLSVAQLGYELVLTWTNPVRNIDQSAVTDLSRVQIFRDGAVLTVLNATGPGLLQSHTLPIRSEIGIRREFALRVETTRDRLSELSNTASIAAVEVPGAVTGLRALFDQYRITVEWQPPRENADLVDAYVVARADRSETDIVTGLEFQDSSYQDDSTYTYQISAGRRINGALIPGLPGPFVEVTAQDRTAPAVPVGLESTAADSGGFLTWEPNVEVDLLGYRVFRGQTPLGPFTPLTAEVHTTNAIFDPDYRSGLYYAVSSVDRFGNESSRTAPFPAP